MHSPSGRERVSVPVAWSRVLTITQLNAAAVGSELHPLQPTFNHMFNYVPNWSLLKDEEAHVTPMSKHTLMK